LAWGACGKGKAREQLGFLLLLLFQRGARLFWGRVRGQQAGRERIKRGALKPSNLALLIKLFLGWVDIRRGRGRR
jgi:hypothetical protein